MGCLSVSIKRVGGDLAASFQRAGGDLSVSFSKICGTDAGLALLATEDPSLLTEHDEDSFLSVIQND